MYDRIIEDYFGIIYGDTRLVFIKTGKGGSIYGYQNKYLNLARIINEKYGYSVVVAANPKEYDCDLKTEIDYINQKIVKISDIVYVGVSNGAVIGAIQGSEIELIRKLILINGPLMINFDKFMNGIKSCKACESISLIYGEKDPSMPYTCLFEKYQLPNTHLIIAAGCDHTFNNKEEEFNRLILDEIAGAEDRK